MVHTYIPLFILLHPIYDLYVSLSNSHFHLSILRTLPYFFSMNVEELFTLFIAAFDITETPKSNPLIQHGSSRMRNTFQLGTIANFHFEAVYLIPIILRSLFHTSCHMYVHVITN